MKASEEIRSILDRCKSGELDHDQKVFYFCETARCVAGWKVHLDYCKKRRVKNPREVTLWAFANERPWTYAQQAWGLDDDQAGRLFCSRAKFPQQYRVVAELEAEGK